MLKLYCIGLCILIVAIVINTIMLKTSIISWYDFFHLLDNYGSEAFKKIGVLDYLWLCIGYPLVLSLGYVAGNKLYSNIFN